MKKRYSIRTSRPNGWIAIRWSPLDPRWTENSYYGPCGRYVLVGFPGKSYSQYLRNPLAKPLLSTGRKSR